MENETVQPQLDPAWKLQQDYSYERDRIYAMDARLQADKQHLQQCRMVALDKATNRCAGLVVEDYLDEADNIYEWLVKTP